MAVFWRIVLTLWNQKVVVYWSLSLVGDSGTSGVQGILFLKKWPILPKYRVYLVKETTMRMDDFIQRGPG